MANFNGSSCEKDWTLVRISDGAWSSFCSGAPSATGTSRMAGGTPLLRITHLLDPEKCFTEIRRLRWPQEVTCPRCGSTAIQKNGHDVREPARQHYRCEACQRYFDDLTATPLEGHHQPVQVWLMCLYFIGLNLSNRQIAAELDVHEDVAQEMCTHLRRGLCVHLPTVPLTDLVEIDEVYLIAGHKGQPAAVREAGRPGRRRGAHCARGRGTMAKDKPPVLGLIQRDGGLRLALLSDVRQETIRPIITGAVAAGATIYTDEYAIYDRLVEWGYGHATVCHARHEYARDDDGDGRNEVHVNTMEGVWSLLRPWLRPHRGVSQEYLPLYLAVFEWLHNFRQRGTAVLCGLLNALLVG
jgi:transposase-like protein